ncbi:RDD family protein [Hydrogenophaga sp.]|uniref:RDD family protein n=1 Tax=Hydrogenophaga sp. TaxID=1904254 RepID=UPI003565DB39
MTDAALDPVLPVPSPLLAPSLSRRMACWLYEGMLMFGVVFVAGYLFSTLTQTRNALDNRHAQQAFLFVVFGIYFTWFWARGQTLAMKTWHIRVVDLQGQALSQPRALLRYVLAWLWWLPPLALAWVLQLAAADLAWLTVGWLILWANLSRLHPQRQFPHDVIAGTRLVHFKPAEPIKKSGKRPFWRV